jgi:hypothetical protein
VLVPQVESKEQKEYVVVLGAHVALRTEPQSGSPGVRTSPAPTESPDGEGKGLGGLMFTQL